MDNSEELRRFCEKRGIVAKNDHDRWRELTRIYPEQEFKRRRGRPRTSTFKHKCVRIADIVDNFKRTTKSFPDLGRPTSIIGILEYLKHPENLDFRVPEQSDQIKTLFEASIETLEQNYYDGLKLRKEAHEKLRELYGDDWSRVLHRKYRHSPAKIENGKIIKEEFWRETFDHRD